MRQNKRTLTLKDERKPADSFASLSTTTTDNNKAKKKGCGYRLLNRRRNHAVIGNTFANSQNIPSAQREAGLPQGVSVCHEVQQQRPGKNEYYFCRGGLIQGLWLPTKPALVVIRNSTKRRHNTARRDPFGEYASLKATTVTHKHNLKRYGNEEYQRIPVPSVDGLEFYMAMSDGVGEKKLLEVSICD